MIEILYALNAKKYPKSILIILNYLYLFNANAAILYYQIL